MFSWWQQFLRSALFARASKHSHLREASWLSLSCKTLQLIKRSCHETLKCCWWKAERMLFRFSVVAGKKLCCFKMPAFWAVLPEQTLTLSGRQSYWVWSVSRMLQLACWQGLWNAIELWQWTQLWLVPQPWGWKAKKWAGSSRQSHSSPYCLVN